MGNKTQVLVELKSCLSTAKHYRTDMNTFAKLDQLLQQRAEAAKLIGDHSVTQEYLKKTVDYCNRDICNLLGIPFKSIEDYE